MTGKENSTKYNAGPPVVSVVGKSDAGKTTLLEKLIAELKKRDFKVGVIKHDAHSFDIDHPGKDSYRLKKAGADVGIISSPAKVSIIRDVPEDLPVFELRDRFLMDMDIVLTEGYKRDKGYKVEVSRAAHSRELLCEKGECLAVVADWEPDLGAPVFALDDAAGVVDLIVEKLIQK